jgi:3-methyl-2-oxobutanoate hydroxymethyltransferase
MNTAIDSKPVNVPSLRQSKRDRRKLVMLTAYDAVFAAALDAAGIDIVLVGDSLGMVVQGHASTVPVSVEDMVYHTACVARGLRSGVSHPHASQHALLVADLPFQSYATPERALDAASALLAEGGAAMVKLEGAGFALDAIRFLVERDIQVCAHLGLTPQSVLKFGGYKVQGRDAAAAQRLLDDALAVEAAGAELLVLECVPSALAKRITDAIAIPTIGIGAGPDCDGQVLVLHDLLGLDSGHRRPRFVKDFLAEGGSITGAVRAFADAVRSGTFPGPEHSYS